MPDSVATQPHITSVSADSVSQLPENTSVADTLTHSVQIENALQQKTCHEVDAPRILHLRNATLGRVAYAEGLAPSPRPVLPGYDSGVTALLVVLFLFIASNFRHYSTFIKTFAQDLFKVRRRANIFDDNNTMSETRVLLSMISLLCVSEGILLYSAVGLRGEIAVTPFAAVGMLSGLAVAYYLCQLAAYRTVGYLFSNGSDTLQWLKGFNASQSLLGLVLVIPALLSLFSPGLSPLLLSLSVLFYGIARLIFISKGFRIFYDNYTSLVYFILYLCTLEIIPPVILCQLALRFSTNI
ncbi:MAG: DUF4271 domain-containing protein [Paramuribaculum sp.]|nr:DUF4271 domain-containing protein [Paramuribaculum sp.]